MRNSRLVIKDAARQLFGRVISALFGFVITKIISSYLGPLRYGDYGTIFRFFARWTALVDFGIYVIAVKQLGALKEKADDIAHNPSSVSTPDQVSTDHTGSSNFSRYQGGLIPTYHKFIGTRLFMIILVYTLAIVVAYLIPAYTDNQFIVWALPVAMMYSASNMFVGIQQLPLQLFRKMNRLSRSLIIARLSQLAVLIPVVYVFFKSIKFDGSQPISGSMILAFCLVVFSVAASSIGQNIDVHLKSRDLLPFKIDIDFSFIKNIFKKNRKYGFAYFFSSFHTLIVLMFLGRFFPTADGYKYVGYRALSLSLIEILLIIPSSLGNSLLHKIPNYTTEHKRKSFGNLLILIGWIAIIIAINFCVFNKEIIWIVSSREFLGSRISFSARGSNQILPFLGIVLALSFIKQVFNYLFVAVDRQNVLFANNLIGIIVGIIVGLYVIPRRNLVGGVVSQLTLEVMFTLGAIIIAYKHKIMPILKKKESVILCSILLIGGIVGFFINKYLLGQDPKLIQFIVFAFMLNVPILLTSLRSIKNISKGLTID